MLLFKLFQFVVAPVASPALMACGIVKFFKPHKGWGFVERNGQDMCPQERLEGLCPSKGDQVKFTVGQTAKGAVAENVTVVAQPQQGPRFHCLWSLSRQRCLRFLVTASRWVWPRGEPLQIFRDQEQGGPCGKEGDVSGLRAATSSGWSGQWAMVSGYGGYAGRSNSSCHDWCFGDKNWWDFKKVYKVGALGIIVKFGIFLVSTKTVSFEILQSFGGFTKFFSWYFVANNDWFFPVFLSWGTSSYYLPI